MNNNIFSKFKKKIKKYGKAAFSELLCLSLILGNIIMPSFALEISESLSAAVKNPKITVESSSDASVITLSDILAESPSNAKAAKVYTAEADGILVTVSAPYGALPEEAELSVTVFSEKSDEYAEAADILDEDSDGMILMDISFLCDGEEVEPSEPVSVSIDVSEVLPEEADRSSVKVTHLEEKGDALVPETVSEKKDVAAFTVSSFSFFTVTWTNGGSSVSIRIYAYHVNGLGIIEEETGYEWNGGSFSINEMIKMANVDEEYTFAYATVSYLTTGSGPGGGASLAVIGGESSSVTGLTLSGTTITVSYGTGQTDSVTGCDSDNSIEFSVNLYFTTPSVTVSASNEHSSQTTLAASSQYFQNTPVTYIWTVSGDTDSVTCTENADGTYTVVWNSDANVGDTVLVTATGVTYDADENILESAAGVYTLVYSLTEVEFTVRKDSETGSLVSGADVAAYDSEGNLISSGTTDSNGKVTLWIKEDEEYIIEVSYNETSSSSSGSGSTSPGGSGGGPGGSGGGGTSSSTTHYTYEGAYTYGDPTILVVKDSEEEKYEHLDIKINTASEAGSGYYVGLAVVDYVEIYDEAGVLLYRSSTLTHNSETNDYNVTFSDANGENASHSINFYTGYTVVVAYEVEYQYYDDDGNIIDVITETYVASIDSSTTYLDDEYYAYNSTNAYRVYNLAFKAEITEEEWNNALAGGTEAMKTLLGDNYDENGICLDGLSYYDVAIMLCDSYGETQAGIDICLGIDSLKKYSSSAWDITLRKTTEGASMEDGEFSFGLYEATVIDDIWTKGSLKESGTNNAADEDESGSASSYSDIVFVFNVDMSTLNETNTYYFILSEIQGDVENITYDDTVYGAKVDITVRSQTSIEINIEYYTLEKDSDSYVISDTFEPLSDTDEDGSLIYYVPFTNVYSEEPLYDVDILKTDEEGTPLEGAQFIVKITTEEYTYGYATSFTTENTQKSSETHYTVTVSEDGWAEEGSEDNAQRLVTTAGTNDTVYVSLTGCDPGYTYYLSAREGAHSGIVLEAKDYASDGTFTTEEALVEKDVEYYIYRKSVETHTVENYGVFSDTGGEYSLTGRTEDKDSATVLISDENGWILTNLPAGTYEIIEIQAPEGYVCAENVVFMLNDEGVHFEGESEKGEGEADITIVDPKVTYVQPLKKVDEEGNVIEATFEIKNEEGKTLTFVTETYTDAAGEETTVYILSEDAEASSSITAGSIYIVGLEPGTYTLTEIESPTGYGVNDEDRDKTFTITAYNKETDKDYIRTEDEIEIINYRDYVEISISKEWNDNNDAEGKRPDSISVILTGTANDKVFLTEEYELTAEEGWTLKVENLRKYDDEGNEIAYAFTEVSMPDYQVSSSKIEKDPDDPNHHLICTIVNGFPWNLTIVKQNEEGNVLEGAVFTLEKTEDSASVSNVSISGKIIWDDNDDADSDRPSSVTVLVYADGVLVRSVEVTEDDGWAFGLTLPEYDDNGKKIEYSLVEEGIYHYTTSSDGYSFTNTHSSGKYSIPVYKVWNDGNNSSGVRPESVTVQLFADGTLMDDTLTLSADNDWLGYFNVDVYDGAALIQYSVEESEVSDYSSSVSGSADTGFTITNTLTIPEASFSVTLEETSEPANGESYVYGEEITGAFVVVNIGEAALSGITVECEKAESTWSVQSLAPGDFAKFEFSYKVEADDVNNGSVVFVLKISGTDEYGNVFSSEEVIEVPTEEISFFPVSFDLTTYASDETYMTGTTDKEGTVKFETLGEGTYVLTEITAPDGYALLEEPVTITFERTSDAINVTINGVPLSECKNAVLVDDTLILTVTDSIITTPRLPDTGGSGTLPFTAAGSLLAGTSLFFLTKRKKKLL